jgi:predicted secreted hydrolase
LIFPDDHAAHPEYRIEWWYVTANLITESGESVGLQWTLFRQALMPDAPEHGWRDGQLWMAHVGLTHAEGHWYDERFGRSGGGQAGVLLEPYYRVWLDDWELRSRRPSAALLEDQQDLLSDLVLIARTPDFSYALSLKTDLPLVKQGNQGFSVKSERGQASWYFSQPFFEVSGQLTLPGEAEQEVTGLAWLDREWSSQPLAAEQLGWDWFSMQFDDGHRLMVFRLREADPADGFRAGTWISPEGEAWPLQRDDIVMTPLSWAQAGPTEVPVRWQIDIPKLAVSVTTEALYSGAWMPTTIPYWEGPIRISGSHTGVGYLEMTGY